MLPKCERMSKPDKNPTFPRSSPSKHPIVNGQEAHWKPRLRTINFLCSHERKTTLLILIICLHFHRKINTWKLSKEYIQSNFLIKLRKILLQTFCFAFVAAPFKVIPKCINECALQTDIITTAKYCSVFVDDTCATFSSHFKCVYLIMYFLIVYQ